MTRQPGNTFESFGAWFESDVQPLGSQHRLDGRESGGNRSVFGRFRRFGTNWKVHADTQIEPLRLAYEAERRGEEPYQIGQSKTGRTLELIPSLQRRRATTAKNLYIYEVP